MKARYFKALLLIGRHVGPGIVTDQSNDNESENHYLDRLRLPAHGAATAHWGQGDIAKVNLSVSASSAIGIDRSQNCRQIELLQTFDGASELRLLTYEPRYWNWEVVREAELGSYPKLVIPVQKSSNVNHFGLEVELPAADTLAEFDTLLIDRAGWCKDHKPRLGQPR